jgi:hypothetical protein
MAKLKTFEQYVSEMDRAEEIEKEIVDLGTPEEESPEDADKVQSPEQEANEANGVTGIEADELKNDLNDKTPEVIDADGKKYAKAEDRAEDDSAEVNKDLKDQADGEDIGKEVSEAEEKEETPEEEADETPEEQDAEKKSKVEIKRPVSEMLKECYGMMKEEAAAWANDEHDEHTIETYMTENASLIGGFAANTLKEMKEDYALEAYEAACNQIKEAFCKKVDECKDSNMTPGEREEEAANQ